MNPRKLTPAQEAEIVNTLLTTDETILTIAQKYNVSDQVIWYTWKRFVPAKKRREIKIRKWCMKRYGCVNRKKIRPPKPKKTRLPQYALVSRLARLRAIVDPEAKAAHIARINNYKRDRRPKCA